MTYRAFLCGMALASAASWAGPAMAADAPISMSCGGATITMTPGAEPVTLTCGGATISLAAKDGKARRAAPAPAAFEPEAAPEISPTVAAVRHPAMSPSARVNARVLADNGYPELAFMESDTLAGGDAIQTAAQASASTNAQVAVENAKTAEKAAKDAVRAANAAGAEEGPGGLEAKDFYVGTGFALSQNLGSQRASEIKFVQRSDGRVLAQIQKDEDSEIGLMFETHYLLKNQGIGSDVYKRQNDGTMKWVAAKSYDTISRLAACGPFALVSGDGQRSGCGPMFSAVMDDDGKISKFGVGWMLGLGKDLMEGVDARASFGIGIGVLVDTDAKTVDGDIVDTDSMLVRPEYQAGVLDGTISTLVSRPSTSLFVMVSKTF